MRHRSCSHIGFLCKVVHKNGRLRKFTRTREIEFKGAVSRYSVIFCTFLREHKMAAARASVADISAVSRANSFTAKAVSSKCHFPRAIVVFRGLPLWPPLFSPHKMAAKNHRLPWHCRFNFFNRWNYRHETWHTCSSCSWEKKNFDSDILIFAHGLSYGFLKSKKTG